MASLPPPPYILSIDQGTSSTRVLAFDSKGQEFATVQKEFPNHYPKPGWVEHDPADIVNLINECLDMAYSKLAALGCDPAQVRALGITNHRETTVVWDRETGKALYNAIVWLDTRTNKTAAQLIDQTEGKSKDALRGLNGLPIASYFSGVKARWLLDHVPAVKDAADSGRLMFGTVDSWIIYNLTGGVDGGVHVTDVTNASRTALMNINSRRWDPELCSFFGVPSNMLPEIKSSAEVYGHVKSGVAAGVAIASALGDQQAATVGQRCFQPGQAKNTYGTGCFMLGNTGNKAVQSEHGLVTTVAYQLGPNADAVYALEGSIAIAGEAVKWLRDQLHIIDSAKDVNKYAAECQDTGGCHFVPAFSGLFAPYWRSDARGVICGLSQYTGRAHLCRAALEAVCFQTLEVLRAMQQDSGVVLKQLMVDGGMTASDLMIQIQADLLGIPVVCPTFKEATALGAAYAAGLAVGIWKDVDELLSLPHQGSNEIYTPKIESSERETRYAAWKDAVQKTFGKVAQDDDDEA